MGNNNKISDEGIDIVYDSCTDPVAIGGSNDGMIVEVSFYKIVPEEKSRFADYLYNISNRLKPSPKVKSKYKINFIGYDPKNKKAAK